MKFGANILPSTGDKDVPLQVKNGNPDICKFIKIIDEGLDLRNVEDISQSSVSIR